MPGEPHDKERCDPERRQSSGDERGEDSPQRFEVWLKRLAVRHLPRPLEDDASSLACRFLPLGGKLGRAKRRQGEIGRSTAIAPRADGLIDVEADGALVHGA